MCPPPDTPNAQDLTVPPKEDMVPIDTSNAPHLPAPTHHENGTKGAAKNGSVSGVQQAAAEQAHATKKNSYGPRASDFLSNTSNWQVSGASDYE